MAVFVEFNEIHGHPLMINVEHIVCFFPNQKGTEIHLSGGQQVVANKPMTWSYVVEELYDTVKDILLEADAQASLAVIEKLGLDECEACGGCVDEEETFPAGWKPDLKVLKRAGMEEVLPKRQSMVKEEPPKPTESKVDWDEFEDPPHLKKDKD